MVLISGHDGGTGASPLTSIKHAGLPWELGLAETQQTLVLNRLRDRIRVQVDGQLKTGRDLAIAALLGAEEFGFGSSVLVCLGCVMVRKCHMNTCPVGIATQDPRLRKRFAGKPEYIENFMTFQAEQLREYMAELGFRALDEMVGRVDMLEVEPAIEHWKARGLDFGNILRPVSAAEGSAVRCIREQDHGLESSLDHQIIRLAEPAIERGEKVHVELDTRNVHRTVGTMLSGRIGRKYGLEGLPEGTISLHFRGSVGQSCGAWLAGGINMRIEGDTNDYLCKGMSGGRVVVVPPGGARLHAHEDVIAGNVVLYGAVGGEVFIRGLAGERFGVRNSGAVAVVEGVGDHGCEYMTGGVVVVLGPTGYNFAAGMSGGIAYVYDESESFAMRCNLDMVDLESVWQEEDRAQLQSLVEKHLALTDSPTAQMLLENWEAHLPLFVKVMPVDYRKVLERMRLEEYRDTETVSATEEVYHG
jgi:glutamate synthase domain-containing protein 3